VAPWRRVDGGRLELFVQGQLLHQSIAQIGIVVHNQDLAALAIAYNLWAAVQARALSAKSWFAHVSVRSK